MIEVSMFWNTALTIILALIGWGIKTRDAQTEEQKQEIQRIQILLNRTREEIAKEYVTKQEVHHDINRVLDRLDRLEGKLDTFIREQRSAIK
jgi:hypothetical protein